MRVAVTGKRRQPAPPGRPVFRDIRDAYDPGALCADITVVVTEQRAGAVMPAGVGARYGVEGRAGRVAVVEQSGDGASIGLDEARVRSLFWKPSQPVTYLLRNTRLGVASLPANSPASVDVQPTRCRFLLPRT